MPSTGSPPDTAAVVVLLALWGILDFGVIAVDRSDSRAFEYLTNQVWALAVASKAVLIFDLCARCRGHRPGCCGHDYSQIRLDAASAKEPDTELVSPVGAQPSQLGWIATLLFLVVGAAQAGVLGGFFTLVWWDQNLLKHLIEEERFSMAQVMSWNHVRHVSVCFLHLALTWSLRHYLANNASLDAPPCTRRVFVVTLCAFPIAFAAVHFAAFDDQDIYMYSDSRTGFRCGAAFAGCALLAALYFVSVPLDSVTREHRDPHSVARSVVAMAVHFPLPPPGTQLRPS
jgi:hypothetical protein